MSHVFVVFYYHDDLFLCQFAKPKYLSINFTKLYRRQTFLLYIIFVYPYIHTYVRTYIRTYIHTYVRTCVRTYVHTYIHTYIHYIHTYIYTYIHMYIHTYVHMPAYVHTSNPNILIEQSLYHNLLFSLYLINCECM